MEASTIRILVVDDFEAWRQFIVSALSKQPQLRIVAESDGVAAVEKAKELQPELVLLDIGLPSINGIEACRRIRQLSPSSKILFISEHGSSEIVAEAIRSGGSGYVVKSRAGNDLLHAVADVLDGKPFFSAGVRPDVSSGVNQRLEASQKADESRPPKLERDRQHWVEFYQNDESFVHGFCSFARHALNNGNPAIVVATRPHRAAILRRLRDEGVNIDGAIQKGLFVEEDATAVLSKLMRGDMPVGARVEAIADHLISKGAKLSPERSKIAICGELAPTLLDQGNIEGAVLLEHQFDSIARVRSVDVLCGYVLPTIRTARVRKVVQRICAEHSAVKWPA